MCNCKEKEPIEVRFHRAKIAKLAASKNVKALELPSRERAMELMLGSRYAIENLPEWLMEGIQVRSDPIQVKTTIDVTAFTTFFVNALADTIEKTNFDGVSTLVSDVNDNSLTIIFTMSIMSPND